jgi:gas vesicle protein
MDGLKLSMEIVIALISGVVSAAGVWFKLKGTVELQQLKIDTMEEDVKTAQSRITSLKKTVEHNREKNENSVSDLKKEMGDMEMRIIKAIHELTTEINKK